MKKCKIIHINDGRPEMLQNGDFMFVEEFQKAEDILEKYLNEGWEVKQIIPDYSPADIKEGRAFYHSGICVYLEKTV